MRKLVLCVCACVRAVSSQGPELALGNFTFPRVRLSLTLIPKLRGRSLEPNEKLFSTWNKHAFCIQEDSAINSLGLHFRESRLPLIPISGNTVPLSRETMSHLSLQRVNLKKRLPGPEELMTWW